MIPSGSVTFQNTSLTFSHISIIVFFCIHIFSVSLLRHDVFTSHIVNLHSSKLRLDSLKKFFLDLNEKKLPSQTFIQGSFFQNYPSINYTEISSRDPVYIAFSLPSMECNSFSLTHFPSFLGTMGAKVDHYAKLRDGLYFMFLFPSKKVIPMDVFSDFPCLSKIEKETFMETTQVKVIRSAVKPLNIHQSLLMTKSSLKWEKFNLDALDITDSVKDGSYTYDFTGENINVYVLDSGIISSHPDFEGRAKTIYEAPGTETLKLGSEDCDESSHGTHVSGIIGGKFTGVAKRVNLHMLRVKGCQPHFSVGNALAALNHLEKVVKKPCLISLSIGPSAETNLSDVFYERIKYFIEKLEIPVILSAGNGYPGTKKCNPILSSIKDVIVVGAVGLDFKRLNTSNYGPCVDIFAPGHNIWSIANPKYGGRYRELTGTSQAAPFVTGVSALVIEMLGRHLAPNELKKKLMELSVWNVKQASLPGQSHRPFILTPITESSLKASSHSHSESIFETHFLIIVIASCVGGVLFLLLIIFLIFRHHLKKKAARLDSSKLSATPI